jgi:hypothetical protein
VFNPGLSDMHVRAGFLSVAMGFQALWVFKIFARAGLIPLKNPRKNTRREKRPAPDWGTYSGRMPRVKENRAKKAPNLKDLAGFR